MAGELSQIATTLFSFHQQGQANKLQREHQKLERESREKLIAQMEELQRKVEAQAPAHTHIEPMKPYDTPPPPAPARDTMQPLPAADDAPAPAQKPYSAYLNEYGQATVEDVSVGCVPCTRAHLSTLSAALRRGRPEDVAAAREEMAALLEYDLTPEKLAATPDIDRELLKKYAARIDELQADLAGPVPEITTASASLKESLRFARADGVEHPEVQLRLARTEDLVNDMERVRFSPERIAQLSPEDQARVKTLLPQLREARQDLINNVHSVDDLESVTVRIAKIDKALNPPPGSEQVRSVADKAASVNQDFRRDVISAWRGGKQ